MIIISCGSGGDVLPFLYLGRRLKERGHKVTLLSHHCYNESASRSGLDFVPLDSPSEYGQFIEDQPLLNTPKGISEFLRRHSLPKVPLHYQLIAQLYSERDTVLVTRDLFDAAARLACEKLSIPAMWVFMSPSQITTLKLRLELFARVLAPDINRLRTAVGLSTMTDGYSWLRYPDRSIALWPEWFAPAKYNCPLNVTPIGFLIEEGCDTDEISSEMTRLDEGDPPILITAGTGAYLGAEFYTASAEACGILNRRGILVTQYQRQVPKHLPDFVRWFSHLPFRALMPNMGAVIHHGGMGTLSCAMASAVPQLVLPMGADRPDNAARLQRLGVAEVLPPPQWKPEMIAAALRRLMNSRVVRDRCKNLAERLRDSNAASAACELIERSFPLEPTA